MSIDVKKDPQEDGCFTFDIDSYEVFSADEICGAIRDCEKKLKDDGYASAMVGFYAVTMGSGYVEIKGVSE